MHSSYRVIVSAVLMIVATAPLLAAAPSCGSQQSVPAAERLSNRLHWETKSEVQSLGFDIFRSTSMDGKFTRLNDKPLPAARFSLKVQPYEYVDDSIDPCLVYYYYVEALGEDGGRTKASPTMASKPKLTVPPTR